MKGVFMNQFDKILQKLDVKIQNLSKNGENNNGKIDTTKEKDQLAKLLAGAEQEMDDLYSKVYYDNNDDYDSDKKVLIRHHYSRAVAKLSQYKNFLKNLICGYESINDDNGTASVTKRKDVKIRANGSYEEKLNESANAFNVIIRDKKGNEIGRKSYTKSKKGIYTNKDKVAEYNNFLTKNKDMKKYDTSGVGGIIKSMVPILGKQYKHYNDNIADALKHLSDDEAVDLNTGTIYKWNSKSNEYNVVGKFDIAQDMCAMEGIYWYNRR